ncbi:MAG: class I SAM-dependent methyltransferase [bacterium]
MYKCKICNNYLSASTNDSLIIENVPENTFNFSEKTVNLHVADCKACGCVQLIHVPLSPDFDIVYRSIGVSSSYREEKKRQLREFVTSYNLYDANMVEIGCGDGQFLEIINEIGVKKIVGIEAGERNYNECLSKGFNAIYGNLFNILKKEKISNPFDAFVTFHYLEHLPDPIKFATCLYQTIKPGAVGLIEVPNYDYIEKNNIWLEFTKDHRFYYRKRTLSHLLVRCGFNIELIEENNGGICLTAVVRRPESTDSSFFSMKDQIKKDIEGFKRLVDGLDGAFAVYGAGHYSQLLINMVYKEYGIKPIHIFDSNKQKCGHKICSVIIEHRDNTVNMRDCDNIIVICGMYNDEVCNMLSDLGKKIIKWG